MPNHILIVEDEPSIAELISINLLHEGYVIKKALQTEEAAISIRHALPDLIILDWMLPGKSGVQFAKELRQNEQTCAIPILMLTAKGEEGDKVTGLDAGADDYVTKPFSPRELMARVRALLRRHDNGQSDELVTVDLLSLDSIAHRVWVDKNLPNPKEIKLGPTEFRLLEHFMRHPERVHSRTNLLDQVWGSDTYIEERTVDVHIKRLRDALGEVGCGEMVETVRGSGYRLRKLQRS